MGPTFPKVITFMARPRVFVSSTYYDLKHLRSSIENFIEQLGYEPVLSEKDSIAYMPDAPLDESCYREARSSDMFVLIIGGRYGSATSDHQKKKIEKIEFHERYESITQREYESAVERDIPTFILIDSAVDAEYQTFLKNKENQTIKYAHVDSVNVFHFIESIRDKQKNNPVKLFGKYSEIESWLREQWAGTFRELIQRMSASAKIKDIDSKVADLAETTETLKRYLEQVIAKLSPKKDEAIEIIKQENERLTRAKIDAELRSFRYVHHLCDFHKKNIDDVRAALLNTQTYPDFIEKVFSNRKPTAKIPPCITSERAFEEINGARQYLDQAPYSSDGLEEAKNKYRSRRTIEVQKNSPTTNVAKKSITVKLKKVEKK